MTPIAQGIEADVDELVAHIEHLQLQSDKLLALISEGIRLLQGWNQNAVLPDDSPDAAHLNSEFFNDTEDWLSSAISYLENAKLTL